MKLELNSYNQLLDIEIDGESEDDLEEVTEIYIDTTGWNVAGESGIKVYLGNLSMEWDNSEIINYKEFNYDNFSQIDFIVRFY